MDLNKDELFAQLPPEWPESLLPDIQRRVHHGDKVVVLDDDPTGTQTVHGVPVLTEWSVESLASELRDPSTVVYLLTNSRSVPLAQARALNREIARNLQAASQQTGRGFRVVSRSDSTLRGHYPGEVEALIEELGRPVDGVLLIPFFLEGGRYTINDIHYVAEGDRLIPAAETEYAQDATFGYQHSDLKAWAVEKHGGTIASDEVASISIDDLRVGGPTVVEARLDALTDRQVCVVNAAGYRDLEVFVAGLIASEAKGHRFLYRTAASFVRVRGGIAPAPLLTSADLSNEERGGLIVAGSFVQKTTLQIEQARELEDVTPVEVSVSRLLADDRKQETVRVTGEIDRALAEGQHALVYTSRERVTGPDQEANLTIGQTISAGLIDIVNGISRRPAWVIAKGGITSSDVATQGLGIQRALVMGQAIPGVPIWRTGDESRWPDMVYVVFPGNVGGADAVAEMVKILRG
jgi:uncharacterized protein YgbK (DUF1537 family)